MSHVEDTRSIADRRRAILAQWLDGLKTSGDWKRFINCKGKLKVAPARRALAEIEKGPGADAWDDSYFKDGHWSQPVREAFESWVLEELAGRPDRDLFGGQLKGDLGLPLWLEDEPLSDNVRALIFELAEGRAREQKKVKGLERRIDDKDRKILDLDTEIRNMPSRNLAVEEHYEESIRTLRYDAGRDLDLSLGDLFGERKP